MFISQICCLGRPGDGPAFAGGRPALLEVVYTATKAGSEVAYSELWPPAALGHRVQNGVNAFSA